MPRIDCSSASIHVSCVKEEAFETFGRLICVTLLIDPVCKALKSTDAALHTPIVYSAIGHLRILRNQVQIGTRWAGVFSAGDPPRSPIPRAPVLG